MPNWYVFTLDANGDPLESDISIARYPDRVSASMACRVHALEMAHEGAHVVEASFKIHPFALYAVVEPAFMGAAFLEPTEYYAVTCEGES